MRLVMQRDDFRLYLGPKGLYAMPEHAFATSRGYTHSEVTAYLAMFPEIIEDEAVQWLEDCLRHEPKRNHSTSGFMEREGSIYARA